MMAIKLTLIIYYLCIRPDAAAPTDSKIATETSQHESGCQHCAAMYMGLCA